MQDVQTKYRAGTIILKYKEKKILIVQSYHRHWGVPKGHIESSESFEECALRETMEETGIDLKIEDLGKNIILYRGEVKYFIVNGEHIDFNIDKIKDKNEITDIKWISVECIQKQNLLINSHLKKLIPIINREFEML